MPASLKFASPIGWLDPADMDIQISDENRLKVTVRNGKTLTANAFFDGMLVWRPASAGSATGNLELVLQPGLWPKEITKRFDSSAWTELPPGRVVYRSVEWNAIKAGLQELIKTSWDAYHADPSAYGAENKVYDVLAFIPGTAPNKNAKIKDRLTTILNGNLPNHTQALLDDIASTLETWRTFDPSDARNGIPIRATKSLFSLLHDAAAPTTLELEIRNLYGEPLNPLYYLKRLVETATPAWALTAGKADKPRAISDVAPIIVRTLKEGSALYSMMNQKLTPRQPGEDPYRSRLTWEYFADADGVYHIKINAPFRNVKAAPLTDVKTYVQASWNLLSAHINKCGNLFNVPAELMLALIHVEALKKPATGSNPNSPDPHSFRFELTGHLVARDYVDLRRALRDPAATYTFTETVLTNYAKLAGGTIATTADDAGKTEKFNQPKQGKEPRFGIPEPYNSASKLGSKGPASKISWQQLNEIGSLKPSLVKGEEFTLPKLATYWDPKEKKRKYHYEQLSGDPAIGAKATEIYWQVVGGVKYEDGKESVASPDSITVKITPSLPFVENTTALSANGANPGSITWAQLLNILKALRDRKVKAPRVTFRFFHLTAERIDKHEAIATAVKAKYGDLSDSVVSDLVARYLAVQEKLIKFSKNTSASDDSRLEDANNDANYLTLAEAKRLSKIYPGKMSFGIQQTLFDRALLVAKFLKERYGEDFFTANLSVTSDLPVGSDARIDWVWQQAWDNLEFQVALLAGYVKEEAAKQWEKVDRTRPIRHYAVGERMTMYDFPRVAGAYNHGEVAAPDKDKPPAPDKTNEPENQSDWGFWYFGNYPGSGTNAQHGFAALQAAFTLLADPSIAPRANVRLVPDLDLNMGMERS